MAFFATDFNMFVVNKTLSLTNRASTQSVASSQPRGRHRRDVR